MHLQTVQNVDLACVYQHKQVPSEIASKEFDGVNVLVDLGLHERPRHLEVLRLLCLIGIPKTNHVVDAGRGERVLVGYVHRDHVLLVTALALQKLHEAAALAHLGLLEEPHSALPAPSHEPKVAVLREELQLADLTVHDHRVFSLVEDESARVQVVHLHFPALKGYYNMLEGRVDLAGGKLFLGQVVLLRGYNLVDRVTAYAFPALQGPDTDQGVRIDSQNGINLLVYE